MVKLCWKTVWEFLINIQLPYDLAILLGIYPKEITYIWIFIKSFLCNSKKKMEIIQMSTKRWLGKHGFIFIQWSITQLYQGTNYWCTKQYARISQILSWLKEIDMIEYVLFVSRYTTFLQQVEWELSGMMKIFYILIIVVKTYWRGVTSAKWHIRKLWVLVLPWRHQDIIKTLLKKKN